MPYRVEFTKRAARALSELPPATQARLLGAVEKLQSNPRPPGCKALIGRHGHYRIRVGDYRIIYEVIDEVLLIVVVAVGHRRDVYRG